jgi:ubiquinone/menaquinone biosynthesis C-methylase UbiE
MRPDYSDAAINKMLSVAGIVKGDKVCDVGAGVAHLTLKLLDKELDVVAIEPNDAMRANGIKRTSGYSNINWLEGTGEETGQPADSFSLVTFGSSFNVTDRQVTLAETNRILSSQGWFACMWNHRDLNDATQTGIESIIKHYVKDYNYGSRREEQTEIINSSGMFKEVIFMDGMVMHKQKITDCVEAWRSHATLQRQAQEKFSLVINKIEQYLNNLGQEEIAIPYMTRIWMAQTKK